MSGLVIPEHVAAYAAGVFSVHECAEEVADLLAKIGMGRWPAAELRAAALEWIGQHVDRDAVALAVLHLRAGSVVS